MHLLHFVHWITHFLKFSLLWFLESISLINLNRSFTLLSHSFREVPFISKTLHILISRPLKYLKPFSTWTILALGQRRPLCQTLHLKAFSSPFVHKRISWHMVKKILYQNYKTSVPIYMFINSSQSSRRKILLKWKKHIFLERHNQDLAV